MSTELKHCCWQHMLESWTVPDKLMAHVDLCSGIGGFALGFEWAGLSKPVLFCDIEPWSRKILKKHWPDVPIAADVKELANDPNSIISAIGGRPSILSCGYPCQPFSQAGQRRGSEDDRHIWPEIFTTIQKVRPDWVVCENVSGHITMGLDEVLSDLADKANYAVQTFHLGAVSVDAPHRRMRLWIVARNVADTNSLGREQVSNRQLGKVGRGWQQVHEQERHTDSAQGPHVHNTKCLGREGSAKEQVLWVRNKSRQSMRTSKNQPQFWPIEPSICRVAHGIPRRVDRLKGLGNAIVPQISMQIGLAIKEHLDD